MITPFRARMAQSCSLFLIVTVAIAVSDFRSSALSSSAYGFCARSPGSR
jgi:hypothetical protein